MSALVSGVKANVINKVKMDENSLAREIAKEVARLIDGKVPEIEKAIKRNMGKLTKILDDVREEVSDEQIEGFFAECIFNNDWEKLYESGFTPDTMKESTTHTRLAIHEVIENVQKK